MNPCNHLNNLSLQPHFRFAKNWLKSLPFVNMPTEKIIIYSFCYWKNGDTHYIE